MDLFSNVKIPDLSAIDTYVEGTTQTSEWHNIKHETSVAYSSLLGIPVAGLPHSGNSTFNLTSFHWSIQCTPLAKGTCDPYKWDDLVNRTGFKLDMGPTGRTFDIMLSIKDYDQETTQNGFTYLSKVSNVNYVNSSCAVSPQLVESQISCQGTSCSVKRMRRPVKPPGLAMNPLWRSFWVLCTYISVTDLGYERETVTRSEMVEQWIANPDYATMTTTFSKDKWVNMTAIPVDQFNRRLQMAVNTWWDSSLGPDFRMGNLNIEDTSNNGRTKSIS